MLAFILSAFAALLLMSAAPAQAQSQAETPRRVALVVGNDAYRALEPLNNPRLDAGRLATLLASNGFEVDLHDRTGHRRTPRQDRSEQRHRAALSGVVVRR